jgi:hypothetical protein
MLHVFTGSYLGHKDLFMVRDRLIEPNWVDNKVTWVTMRVSTSESGKYWFHFIQWLITMKIQSDPCVQWNNDVVIFQKCKAVASKHSFRFGGYFRIIDIFVHDLDLSYFSKMALKIVEKTMKNRLRKDNNEVYTNNSDVMFLHIPLCVVRGDWMGTFEDPGKNRGDRMVRSFGWDPKNRGPVSQQCGTIKILPCSKALSAEHRPKFCSPSPVMETNNSWAGRKTLSNWSINQPWKYEFVWRWNRATLIWV